MACVSLNYLFIADIVKHRAEPGDVLGVPVGLPQVDRQHHSQPHFGA